MNNVCLVIIYNHNFEKNIPVLNRIYNGRFSNVYHVMPFYRGDDPCCIGVYESSYQFSGYIAQAASRFADGKYSHYVFIADDMVLNPSLNENNLIERLDIGPSDGFTTEYSMLSDQRFASWQYGLPSVMNLMGQANACEWQKFMPTYDAAREKFKEHGLSCEDGVSRRLYEVLRCGCRVKRKTPYSYAAIPPFGFLRKHWKWFRSEDKVYPLAWGYSDFCVVPNAAFKDFSSYAGVMAACRVFVEVAIPTALLLSCARVVQMSNTKWKAEGGVFDYSVRERLEKESAFDYKEFIAKFPENYLFIHPIKLSKWKNLP